VKRRWVLGMVKGKRRRWEETLLFNSSRDSRTWVRGERKAKRDTEYEKRKEVVIKR